jgi:hypothetical protein
MRPWTWRWPNSRPAEQPDGTKRGTRMIISKSASDFTKQTYSSSEFFCSSKLSIRTGRVRARRGPPIKIRNATDSGTPHAFKNTNALRTPSKYLTESAVLMKDVCAELRRRHAGTISIAISPPSEVLEKWLTNCQVRGFYLRVNSGSSHLISDQNK